MTSMNLSRSLTRRDEQRLKEIDALMDAFDFAQAQSICRSILTTQSSAPSSPSSSSSSSSNLATQPVFLLKTAAVELEMGCLAEAKQALQTCLSLDPSCWEALLELAQLHCADEAITLYWQAIHILSHRYSISLSISIPNDVQIQCTVAAADSAIRDAQKVQLQLQQQSDDTESAIKDATSAIVSALVSIAELYMTDCCEAEDAESNCSAVLREALRLQPESIEALYAECNFTLCRTEITDADADADGQDTRHQAAFPIMQKLLNILTMDSKQQQMSTHPDHQQEEQEQEPEEDLSIQDVPNIPANVSFELLLAITRVAIELQRAELQPKILKLLSLLEQLDDQVLDIPYLFAVLFAQMGQQDLAMEAIEDARSLMAQLRKENNGLLDDPEMEQAIEHLANELAAENSSME